MQYPRGTNQMPHPLNPIIENHEKIYEQVPHII